LYFQLAKVCAKINLDKKHIWMFNSTTYNEDAGTFKSSMHAELPLPNEGNKKDPKAFEGAGCFGAKNS